MNSQRYILNKGSLMLDLGWTAREYVKGTIKKKIIAGCGVTPGGWPRIGFEAHGLEQPRWRGQAEAGESHMGAHKSLDSVAVPVHMASEGCSSRPSSALLHPRPVKDGVLQPVKVSFSVVLFFFSADLCY